MAAYYFAGLLSSTFGKQIQSSLGIDQLEITPLLLKGDTDPTARVTVGKRVSDTVKIALLAGHRHGAEADLPGVLGRLAALPPGRRERHGMRASAGSCSTRRQFGGTPIGRRAARRRAGDRRFRGRVASVVVSLRRRTVRARARQGSEDPRPAIRSTAGRMLQGADHIRTALLKDGFIQATVRAEAVLEAGPPPTLPDRLPRIAGTANQCPGRHERRQGQARRFARSLRTFWRETPYTPDFWDEAVQRASRRSPGARLLRRRRHVASARTVRRGAPIRVLVDRGKPVRLRAVRFTGVASIPRERIDKQMTSLKSQALRKRLLRPSVLTEDLRAVRALYREEGFTRVRIGQPRIVAVRDGRERRGRRRDRGGTALHGRGRDYSGGDALRTSRLRAATPMLRARHSRRDASPRPSRRSTDRFDALGYPGGHRRIAGRASRRSGRTSFSTSSSGGERDGRRDRDRGQPSSPRTARSRRL